MFAQILTVVYFPSEILDYSTLDVDHKDRHDFVELLGGITPPLSSTLFICLVGPTQLQGVFCISYAERGFIAVVYLVSDSIIVIART